MSGTLAQASNPGRHGEESPSTGSRKLIPGKILGAAAEEFIEHGYGSASMDLIARRAGVSKATIYAHFENKEGLFAAIIRDACEEMRKTWGSAFGQQTGLRAALRAVGLTFATFIMAPRTVAVFRVVVSETRRFPELGRILYESGPAIGLGHLAAYLADAAAKGELVLDDPRRAADQFIAMIRGELYLRAVLGLEGTIASSTLEALVDETVETFMRAFRRPS
mgnify:CR=1 FL=1